MGGGCMPGVTGGQVRVGKRAVGVGAQCHTHTAFVHALHGCLLHGLARLLGGWSRVPPSRTTEVRPPALPPVLGRGWQAERDRP